METAQNGDVSLRYDTAGEGPTVAFCGDIGLGPWQFGWQYAAVAGPYEAVVPESRGVGDSTANPTPASTSKSQSDTDPSTGELTIPARAADLEAVLSNHGTDRVHLLGYGSGGMVALQYAIEYTRARSLTVFGTPASGDIYDATAVWAPPTDTAAVRASLEAAFTAEFCDAHASEIDQIIDWRASEDADRSRFQAHRAGIEEFDISDQLYELALPTLVIQGEADQACPPEAGTRLAERLPRGELMTVETGHFAGIEASALVNDALRGWLDEQHGD